MAFEIAAPKFRNADIVIMGIILIRYAERTLVPWKGKGYFLYTDKAKGRS